jgi:AcrR family transcriptional regulator
MYFQEQSMAGGRTQAERTHATRARLIELGRASFARDGFGGTPAEELVRQAGLTRGALYHHFGGKEGLFLAVYQALQHEIAERIEAAANAAPDAWEALRGGCRAFLDACTDPDVQRIVLLDAPTVLGWERWRQVDAAEGVVLLLEGLREAIAAGALPDQPVEPLAHLLAGAMNEAAMWIARAPDPAAAHAAASAALDRLLNGLRCEAIERGTLGAAGEDARLRSTTP